MFKDKKNEIKKALLKGGLVIAERGVGKTTALLEILLDQTNMVIIVPTHTIKERYTDLLIERFPGVYTKMDFSDTIILDSYKTEERLKGLHKDVYIDEYFLCKYRGPFKAAVGTLPLGTTIIE